MKINAINFYTSTQNHACKPKSQNVHFGFGEDYGPDPNEQEYNRNASDPSTLRSLWLLVEIPAVLIKEAVQDAIAVHRETRKYKAMYKEQEKLKQQEQIKLDQNQQKNDIEEISDEKFIDNEEDYDNYIAV